MRNAYILILLISGLFLVGCQSQINTPDKTGGSGGSAHTSEQSEDMVCAIPEDNPVMNSTVSEGHSELLLDNILSGGPPPDGIPPIEEPQYVSVQEGNDFLEDDSMVFVLELDHETYIYPQSVLVWHEIVNLESDGLALTYCPLTGSAITYEYPAGLETTLGTSGSLINSNLLMYDRKTSSYISQIDGVGLNLSLEGEVLNTKPTFWTPWKNVKDTYSDAKVLSLETGFSRDYRSDPYGSYVDNINDNYYENDRLIFKPIHEDAENTFSNKYPIIGIKVGEHRVALDPKVVKENASLTFEIGEESFIALYDKTIDNVRVYYNPENRNLHIEDNKIIDLNNEWQLNGISLNGLETLHSPNYFQVMWFGWYAFYPETKVVK